MLASAIRVLHARPVLTRTQIEAAMTAIAAVLAPSDLAADVERVKLTQLPLNLEELSKLWSVFFQTTYRAVRRLPRHRRAARGRDPGGAALPVLRRNALRRDAARADRRAGSSTRPATTLPITFGDAASGCAATGCRRPSSACGSTDGRDRRRPDRRHRAARDAAAALPVGHPRPPGPVHERVMGTPPIVHPGGVASDVVPYVLAPRIHKTGGAYDVAALNPTSRVVDGVVLHSADVRVVLEPTIGRRQRVAILLNELTGAAAHAYTFVAPPRPADATTITVRAVDVIPATYLLRVQVDGVDSVLDVVAGAYAEPKVAL